MNVSWAALAAVGGGGALGAVSRYLVGVTFMQWLGFGAAFPLATLFINVSGSFLIGVVIQLEVTRALGVTPLMRLFLATGILGGYTTFSAFSYETMALFERNQLGLALLYAGGSVMLGLAACYVGTMAVRLVAP